MYINQETCMAPQEPCNPFFQMSKTCELPKYSCLRFDLNKWKESPRRGSSGPFYGLCLKYLKMFLIYMWQGRVSKACHLRSVLSIPVFTIYERLACVLILLCDKIECHQCVWPSASQCRALEAISAVSLLIDIDCRQDPPLIYQISGDLAIMIRTCYTVLLCRCSQWLHLVTMVTKVVIKLSHHRIWEF